MWRIITGSLLEVNRTNQSFARLKAQFAGGSDPLTVDATTLEFAGSGGCPLEVHWRGNGQGWVLVAPTEIVPACESDHNWFDLPKLLRPDRYPEFAEVCAGEEPTVILDYPAARLLGNSRGARVVAEIDRRNGIIRSYRAETDDGATLRTVALTYAVSNLALRA